MEFDEIVRRLYVEAQEKYEYADDDFEDDEDVYYGSGGWYACREYYSDYRLKGAGKKVDGLGAVFVESNYGGEGDGDQYWIVFRVELPDGRTRYVRVDGWYQSYSGGEYDGDPYEVFPVQRQVTFYEKAAA